MIDYAPVGGGYRCFFKKNGRLVATIHIIGEIVRLQPAVGMDGNLGVTDWRTFDDAKRELESLAVLWAYSPSRFGIAR